MKNIIIVSLLLSNIQIFCQSPTFIHLDIKEDTFIDFFNHFSAYINCNYSDDSVQFYTMINKMYLQGRIGNGQWVTMDNHTRMASVISTLPPGERKVYGNTFQIFQDMDIASLDAFKEGNNIVEFRYYASGSFMAIYDGWAPYYHYYSNIDTVFLPPVDAEDLNAFAYLKEHVTIGQSH